MSVPPRVDLETHEVRNQPEIAGDRDLWRDDPIVQQLVAGTAAATDDLARYAVTLGRQDMREAAREANRNPPEARLFDSGGRRVDEVRYHPAYHLFMRTSMAAGYHSVAWEGRAGGHLTHACMVYLASQVEPGHCCPLTMTYAAMPVLRKAEGLGEWPDRMLSRDYDPAILPVAQKHGATVGMAMTEKQGGSDIRSNTTRAVPDGAAWRLTGHKWFCSAPMSDGFLTLAQTDHGLTCFLVPRWLDDARNGILIQRLKDKLGNRSNASAEIEYRDALAYPIGDGGDGVRTIVEMVHHTRLDTAIAPAGLMRAALREAHHWVARRSAFQKRLMDQPLMRSVLADITFDWVGTLALGLRVARSFDDSTAENAAFARIGVALAKYQANKLCPQVVGEAMEAMGGMGYIEDTQMPMLYREAPLNGIWEGSANVICLDALRTLHKDPSSAEVLGHELDRASNLHAGYDAALDSYRARWNARVAEVDARHFVEQTALLLTASILLRHDNAPLAEAFVQTRLSAGRGRTVGGIDPASADVVLRECFVEGG